MEHTQRAAGLFRQIVLITVIGFLVVVLAGPVLTVVGVLLPFALVGLLVWIPIRLFMVGRQGGMAAVGSTVGTTARKILAVPGWLITRFGRAVKFVFGTALALVGLVVGIVFPVLVGGVLGGTLGVIGGLEHHDALVRVPAAVAIGAGIGLLTALWPATKPRPKFVEIRPIVVEGAHRV